MSAGQVWTVEIGQCPSFTSAQLAASKDASELVRAKCTWLKKGVGLIGSPPVLWCEGPFLHGRVNSVHMVQLHNNAA